MANKNYNVNDVINLFKKNSKSGIFNTFKTGKKTIGAMFQQGNNRYAYEFKQTGKMSVDEALNILNHAHTSGKKGSVGVMSHKLFDEKNKLFKMINKEQWSVGKNNTQGSSDEKLDKTTKPRLYNLDEIVKKVTSETGYGRGKNKVKFNSEREARDFFNWLPDKERVKKFNTKARSGQELVDLYKKEKRTDKMVGGLKIAKVASDLITSAWDRKYR